MIFKIIFRTTFFYFFIVFCYKLMGKKEVGKLDINDFIVSMLISQIIALSIESYKEPFYFALIPLVLVCIFQIVLSYLTLKNNNLRKIFDGKESVIINKGIINFKEMIKQRYTLSDLLFQLRDKDIRTIDEVDYAILETNGSLSVFKKDDKNNNIFPLPLILDGNIEESNLKLINKNNNWLLRIIDNNNLKLNDIFYSFYKDNKVYFIRKN